MDRFRGILIAALLACTSAPAAASDVYLEDSLRLLGAGRLAAQKGDRAGSERHGGAGKPTLYAERDRDHLLVDGVKVMLSEPVGLLKGRLTVARLDYDKVLVPLYWRQAERRPMRRIMLDPGHGGTDPGKQHANYNEKTVAFDTAVRVKAALEKQGFEVLLTRSKDASLALPARPALAGRFAADLFVSIHYNSAGANDTTSGGIETYCLTPPGMRSTNVAKGRPDLSSEPGNRFDIRNLQLAWSVQRHLLAGTGAEDRGVRRARFAVLRPLPCPGILIEGGFVSSRREGALIGTPAYRQQVADAIAAGISEYARSLSPAPLRR
ncbi:MAG: N-acetylmuramoyl-L-alanine amidase family protein [Opitutales bacterium]